jgi:hypothetical protein
MQEISWQAEGLPACKSIYLLHFPRFHINELLLTEWPMHWHLKNCSPARGCVWWWCYYYTWDKLFDNRSQLLSTSAFSRVSTFVGRLAKIMVTLRILAWEHIPTQCMQPNASCLRHSQLVHRNRHSCEYSASNCIHSHYDCYDLDKGQSIRPSS